jgi:hypothetical protein
MWAKRTPQLNPMKRRLTRPKDDFLNLQNTIKNQMPQNTTIYIISPINIIELIETKINKQKFKNNDHMMANSIISKSL